MEMNDWLLNESLFSSGMESKRERAAVPLKEKVK